MSPHSLQELFDQLPQPVMILTDFNSHNTIWVCMHTNIRGIVLESFAGENELSIRNNGSPTRVEYNAESCLDIALVTPRLQSEMQSTSTASTKNSETSELWLS